MTESRNKHLERIRIEGFKSIEKIDLVMNPINILIGANGSGKSNFISIFTFLRNLSEGKLESYVEKNGGANSFLHFGVKHTPSLSIGVEVGYNGYYSILESGNNDNLVFDSEYCTIKSSNKRFPIKGLRGESGLLPGAPCTSPPVRNYTRRYLERCRVYHFHDTGPSAGFRQVSKLSSSDYLFSDAANIAAFLYCLKNSDNNEYQKSYRNIVSAIQTVAPFFHDFYLESRGQEGDENIILKWLHKEHENPFSASQLSDGTARFICMATLFLQPAILRPNTIVLDEPELGLHPAALEVLADLVKLTSKENQVICSTQSVTFANHFDPEDFIVVDQSKGVSKFKRLDAEDLGVWLEEYQMGDIWNKNLIGGRPEW